MKFKAKKDNYGYWPPRTVSDMGGFFSSNEQLVKQGDIIDVPAAYEGWLPSGLFEPLDNQAAKWMDSQIANRPEEKEQVERRKRQAASNKIQQAQTQLVISKEVLVDAIAGLSDEDWKAAIELREENKKKSK